MAKANHLIKLLKKKKLSLATVESCSAGYLSYLLTKTPGASSVFKGGIIAYSLQAKNKLFKIPFSVLKESQGVSRQIALLLAKRVKKLFTADIGASIVGFAGPEGKKGLVFIAVADKKGATVKKLKIKGTRDKVRKKASHFLIDLILSV